MKRNGWIALIAGIVIVCCCVTTLAGGLAGYVFYNSAKTGGFDIPNPDGGPPGPAGATENPDGTTGDIVPTSTPRPVVRSTLPASAVSEDGILLQAESAALPREDLADLAVRYKGVDPAKTKVDCSKGLVSIDIGATRSFTLSNQDDNTQFEVNARLEYKTDHVYMWVETKPVRLRLNKTRLTAAADDFESKIYTTNRAFFGNEASPGVDCDPHIYILHASGVGSSVGGYFSSPDGYPKSVRSDSNEAEMFVTHAAPGFNGANPGSPTYMSTLAHEFEHMISYNQTHAANLWLEEGGSQFAERLNGYADNLQTPQEFASSPETQLNTWAESSAGGNGAHYGAGYLFWSYLYDRFGEAVVKKLGRNPERSIQSFMKTLEDEGVTNPDTGKPFIFRDLFADFVVANYMNRTEIEPGGSRYNYKSIDVPTLSTHSDFTNADYPVDVKDSVNNFGTHYIRLSGDKPLTVNFTGSTIVPLLPMDDPHGAFWWSNRGDASNLRLTREVDLSAISAGKAATLKYRAWYRLEKDYDYGYVSVSDDGGTRWKTIKTSTCTTTNPQNANLGCGYTGSSNSVQDAAPLWVNETADLSPYAGKKILLRFETVSDAGVNREGIAIDDLEIPEIKWTDDASTAGDWKAEGFVRGENPVPQEWKVQAILTKADGSYELVRMTLSEGAGSLKIDLGKSVTQAVLLVSATTQVTTEPGSYQLQIK